MWGFYKKKGKDIVFFKSSGKFGVGCQIGIDDSPVVNDVAFDREYKKHLRKRFGVKTE